MDAIPFVILLVMEYRSRANTWLSGKLQHSAAEPQRVVADGLPSAGPLEGVRDMLIADKVQGRREFIRLQRGRHGRSDELDLYFEMWLKELEVDAEAYDQLGASIDLA